MSALGRVQTGNLRTGGTLADIERGDYQLAGAADIADVQQLKWARQKLPLVQVQAGGGNGPLADGPALAAEVEKLMVRFSTHSLIFIAAIHCGETRSG